MCYCTYDNSVTHGINFLVYWKEEVLYKKLRTRLNKHSVGIFCDSIKVVSKIEKINF